MPADPRPRRWPVTVLGAGLIVALVLPLGLLARRVPAPTPAAPGPAAVLEAAAAAAESAPGTPPPPGLMRYVAARRVTLEAVPDGDHRRLVRTGMITEEWIPADRRRPWTQWIRDDGPPQAWDERTGAYTAGDPVPASRWSARCGAYFPVPGADPCRRPGLWQDPTPAFVAGLPGDPGALLARLRSDAAGDDLEALTYAAQALSRDLLPSRVRATVYRALALLPGLGVTAARCTLGRRTGTALGLGRGGERLEIVVDERGAYLGSIRRLTAARDGLAAGTVTDTTEITTGLARRGRTP
ncbi:hypothetical protein [Actinoplanes sp. NPDC049316]|uniref:hypothetical protein n=1 Tax=Actinoplanes sp. NPDC049316 TaxID=3154727 RepID=UPI00341D7D2F